jgi:hypothetical protein
MCGDTDDIGDTIEPMPELTGDAGLDTRAGVPAGDGDGPRRLGVLSIWSLWIRRASACTFS